MARYDITTATLGTLLADPDVVAIMEKHAPGITTGMPAAQAVAMAGGMIGGDAVSAITDEVTSLN